MAIVPVNLSVDLPDPIPGPPGKSAYELWLEDGHTGTYEDFEAFNKGEPGIDGFDGDPGAPGDPGKSAYELWVENGHAGATYADYEAFNKGQKGDPGTPGSPGSPGAPGKSAYELWLENGHTGTYADYEAFNKGEPGTNGTNGTNGTGGDPNVIYAASTSEADVRAAINAAIASKTAGVARKVVQLPPGTITIASPDLIGSPTTGTSDQIFGLTIRGHGERVTTISFTHPGVASSDPRQNNLFTLANRVRNLRLEGIKFTSSNPNNNMAWFWSVPSVNASSIYPEYGIGQNQRIHFVSCEWGGKWNRVVGIDGDVNTNNNSEWTFRDCCTDTTAQFTDAFLHCGGISGLFTQQAQYLNFRFDNCNFCVLSGTLLRWDKGGAIMVTGGSWSAASNANPITWFYMPYSTDQTAMRISVRDVRFEPKADDQLIIDCRWGNGHVVFDHCTDISSLQNSTSAAYKLHRYTAVNNRIPLVAYRDCTLVGGHEYIGFNGGRGKAIYDASTFYGMNNGFTKAVADTAGANDAFLRYSAQKPALVFRDCDNIADQNYTI